MKIWDSIKNNHFAMMAVCCLLPVIVILGLQAAGITAWWLYPLAIFICIGSHVLMMGMSAKDHAHGADGGKKEGGSCH